jgi:hypothetical protein
VEEQILAEGEEELEEEVVPKKKRWRRDAS